MNIIEVESLLKKVSNRYELVNLAAKRSKQLMAGSTPLVNGMQEERVNIIALEEIKRGRVLLQREDSSES
ncbi:MAG: DNA-directed RNA polymerase subunit omega [bacterium]